MSKVSGKEEIAEIYIRNHRSLFILALTYVNDINVAEELVSDAILALYEHSPIFASEASCVCYLRQIIRNKAKNWLRKKYRIEPTDGEIIENGFIELNLYEHPYNDVEVQLLIQELLKEYSPAVREAFVAHVIDRESISDLAEYYGIKKDTLKKQIRRMKKHIAKVMPERKMREILFTLALLP